MHRICQNIGRKPTLDKATTKGKGGLNDSTNHEHLLSSIEICQSAKEQEHASLNYHTSELPGQRNSKEKTKHRTQGIGRHQPLQLFFLNMDGLSYGQKRNRDRGGIPNLLSVTKTS